MTGESAMKQYQNEVLDRLAKVNIDDLTIHLNSASCPAGDKAKTIATRELITLATLMQRHDEITATHEIQKILDSFTFVCVERILGRIHPHK